jgi:hypothetical protein
MPPVQMTRAQYEAKYGTKPVASSSDLDTTPAPIRMTRAEYNAKYRPTPLTAKENVQQDFLEMGQGVDTALQQGKSNRERIYDRVVAGEVSPAKGTFQTLGRGLQTGFQVGAEALKGFVKMVLPESVEMKAKETAEATGEELSNYTKDFYQKLKEGNKEEQEIAATIGETIELYKTDETFRDDVNAAGGFLEALSMKPAAKVTTTAARETGEAILDTTTEAARIASEAKNTYTAMRQDSRVANVAKEIAKVEDKYKPTREANLRDPDIEGSRLRIAASNVLERAVDTDGLIRTREKGGALDTYRKNTIEGKEDSVKKLLEQEGRKVNLQEVGNEMKIAMMDSGLESADLAKAIKGINNEIKGLSLRADEFGDVLLSAIQDAKISTYRHIDYKKPTGVTYRKAIARVFKEIIENKSAIDIKSINAELAKYYNDLDRISDLDGKRVVGGRLGKYTAQLAGSAIGGVAGSTGGAAGAVVGGIVGGELSSALKGASMSRTFRGGVDGKFPETTVLNEAKAQADAGGGKDLKTPDRPVGASKAIMSDPNMPESIKKEIAKVEGQIKKNVAQQKAAIKAGDFTLVEALKEVYEILVAKLKDSIKFARENYKSEGGYIKNPLAQNQAPDRMRNQTQAPAAPTNAQNISSTVPSKTKSVKLTEVEKQETLEALNGFDEVPLTVIENGKSRIESGDLNKEFRLGELKAKADQKALTDAEIAEANQLLKERGGLVDLPTTPNLADDIATPSLLEEARKYKSAADIEVGQKLIQNNGNEMDFVGRMNTPKGTMYAFKTKGQPEGSFELYPESEIDELIIKQNNLTERNTVDAVKKESVLEEEKTAKERILQQKEDLKLKEAEVDEFLSTLETGDRLNASKSLKRLVNKNGRVIKEYEAIDEYINDGYKEISELRQTKGAKKGQLVKVLVSGDGRIYPLDNRGMSAYAEFKLSNTGSLNKNKILSLDIEKADKEDFIKLVEQTDTIEKLVGGTTNIDELLGRSIDDLAKMGIMLSTARNKVVEIYNILEAVPELRPFVPEQTKQAIKMAGYDPKNIGL